MAELDRFDIDDDPDEIIAAVDLVGAVIVERFISEDLCSRVVDELMPSATTSTPGTDGGIIRQAFFGANTKRFSGLAHRAPSFADIIDHPLLHRWADHGFRTDYWLNTGQAIVIGPGEPAQFLHRDVGNWPIMEALGRDGPEATLAMMLALSDFTEENGATRVVPGSHRWDDFALPADPGQTVGATMPAGSALLYSGKVVHGGGANVSDDRWRFGVHLSFVLAQLTPEEAHTVTTPWDSAQHFSERVQHMLCYRSHRTILPDWPILWTADYGDVRDALEPQSAGSYVSAGQRHLGQPEPDERS